MRSHKFGACHSLCRRTHSALKTKPRTIDAEVKAPVKGLRAKSSHLSRCECEGYDMWVKE